MKNLNELAVVKGFKARYTQHTKQGVFYTYFTDEDYDKNIFDSKEDVARCQLVSEAFDDEKIIDTQNCDLYLVDAWTPGTLEGCINSINETKCQHTNLKHISGKCHDHDSLHTVDELQNMLNDERVRYVAATKNDGSEMFLKFDYKICE